MLVLDVLRFSSPPRQAKAHPTWRIISRGPFRLLEIAHLHERASAALPFHPSRKIRPPRLALEKPGTTEEFFSSLIAVVQGPAPPEEFAGDAYFRDCWVDQTFPRAAFVAAIALQALLILYPPPIWNIRPAHTASEAPRAEITWYDPAKDFPAILPEIRPVTPTARNVAPKPPTRRGADALSEPLHPTHPRQTLVQTNAPKEPPKILPALPNIVQLASSQPERPKLQLSATELTSLRPKTPASLSAANVAAPEISATEKQTGAIDIAASSHAPAKPLLPVNPMSAPRAAMQKTESNAAAPEISGRPGDPETLIALSATPAPVAPPAIPAGNLSARVSISPDGPKPGTPSGSASGSGPSGGTASGGGGRGPEGIFISGGNGANSAPTSGLGIGPTSREGGSALPSRPIPRVRTAPEGSKSLSADAEQEVLGPKHVYTLHVNMPNLTSASGSWILNFAELNESMPGNGMINGPSELAGPVPLRKVDPKYPPELRTSHVDGEVVLYAIIRKDGSVDSIQLVHSVDPHLDANAMEALAQWKFRPAEKRGEPIDLEAVVHIPFRSRGPVF